MNSFPVLYANTYIPVIMTLLVEKLTFCLFFDLKLVKYAVGIVISKLFCLNSSFNIFEKKLISAFVLKSSVIYKSILQRNIR